MILPVLAINPRSLTQKYSIQPFKKTNSLQRDVFERQEKAEPSFGRSKSSIIPSATIVRLCNDFLKEVEEVGKKKKETKVKFKRNLGLKKGANRVAELTTEFFKRYLPENFERYIAKRPENEHPFLRTFKHELVGAYNETAVCLSDVNLFKDFILIKYPEAKTKAAQLEIYKSEIRKVVEEIKRLTREWAKLEKYWNESESVIAGGEFINLLQLILKVPLGFAKASMPGLIDFFKGKEVKNPFQLYDLLSQPILNARKYGKSKPFEIAIEEVTNGGKTYYAYITNPDTILIPDKEIDEILKGSCYRAEETRDIIEGTGFGFSEIIRILRENGYEDDIPQLIEKGREKGVCVRIPLIGVTD
ncbi:MAG: hypothetical protein PHC64_03010 [Candidatus Gastranaerophilales bacterium]|nr:hypothetical protein [Candidatus Gastranaerophilales bacterium]